MRPRLRIAVAASVLAMMLTAAAAVYLLLFHGTGSSAIPRAVIVDQLAATDPNEGFVSDATTMLEDAGYAVDYVPPSGVTVDLYRDLPRRGYELVILRTHSAAFRTDLVGLRVAGASAQVLPALYTNAEVSLFTNEAFTYEAHWDDILQRRLGMASYDYGAGESFFGIMASFILESARGRFPGSTIVLMGCGGLSSNGMAAAFMSKGASGFVSWDGPVGVWHTDQATTSFLRHLLVEGRTAAEAVELSMAEVGPDPDYGARLLAYGGQPRE